MKMKKLFKSKTMMFNFLVAAGALLESQVDVLGNLVGPEHLPLLTLGVAMVNLYLRIVTTKPLSDK